MVSQNSPPSPESSILHHFINSDPLSNQTHFQSQHFDDFGTGLRYHEPPPGVMSIHSLGERISRSLDLVQAPPMVEDDSAEEINNHRKHLMDLLGTGHHQSQRLLSLSLSSNMLVPPPPPPPIHFRQRPINPDLVSPSYFVPGPESSPFPSSSLTSPTQSSSSCSATYGSENLPVAIRDSKYLKPTQLLLEEVVNAGGREVELSNEKFMRKLSRNSRRGSLAFCSELRAELCNNDLYGEKRDLQIKLVKLISLLEEVERKYEQYYYHLEGMVSSFEMIAGVGAGKSYTTLALQAMSKHFCSLRDSITAQIVATKRKYFQDLPQLTLFDQEARHNRVPLQQLGAMQNQKQMWRPIRGLPETSVSILRTWLFEHFLHPYPNETEKLMLSSQTGLSKNQVSNWFINARVRLWKPMIEEMYKEEFGDASADSDPPMASGSFSREQQDFTDHKG